MTDEINKVNIDIISDENNSSRTEMEGRIIKHFDKEGYDSYSELLLLEEDIEEISILKINESNVGCRFYLPSKNKLVQKTQNYFSVVTCSYGLNQQYEKYEILLGKELEKIDIGELFKIVTEAYKTFYKEKTADKIIGKPSKIALIPTLLAEKYKGNTNCKIVPINNEVEKCIWNENFTWDKLPQIPENYKFVIYPVASKEHATLLIQSKDKNILLDTSLQHAKIGNRTQVRKAIFGDGAKDISIFPKEIPLQANSTCSFWMDSLMEVIVSNPKKYDSMDAIERSIKDGTLWIEASVIMSRKFDKEGEETIREFDNENDDGNYIKFKVDGKVYGINKNCADNRFINIKSLCKLLSECGIKTDLKGESIADIIDKQTKKQPEINMERPTSYKLSVKGSEALVEKISKISENKKSRKAFEAFLQIVTNKVIDYELKENQVNNESEEGKKIKKKYNTICASILDGTDTISNSDCIITTKDDARFYKAYLDTVESLKYREEDCYLNKKTENMTDT